MSNNIFSGKRFWLLCKQHYIQNNQLLLLGTVAYIGLIMIILSFVQMANDLTPHDLEIFQNFLIAFVGIFGVLFVGYSFPAFRSKESTINYLMVPSSVFEKFIFEFVSRAGVIFILLPLIFWMSFNMQGFFFSIFIANIFEPVGVQYLVHLDIPEIDNIFWISTMIGSWIFLAFVLGFTGAAMFTKQPLVKTLFCIAVIVIFFIGYAYIVLEELGVGKYDPTESMWLIPRNELGVFQFFTAALLVANAVFLFVAFRKLKEREV